MPNKPMEFYGNQEAPDQEIGELMAEEIKHSPKATGELVERLIDFHSSSPAISGGDIDATWEESEDTGDETVFSSNPTPDQSDVERNAHAMGIDFQDNEELDFVEKIEERDENRFELDERSKTNGSI